MYPRLRFWKKKKKSMSFRSSSPNGIQLMSLMLLNKLNTLDNIHCGYINENSIHVSLSIRLFYALLTQDFIFCFPSVNERERQLFLKSYKEITCLERTEEEHRKISLSCPLLRGYTGYKAQH